MICPGCNTANRPGVAFCASCGQRLPVAGPADRKGLATAALVLGIISVPLLYVVELSIVMGLAAVVCGVVALVNVKRHPLEYGGKSLAMAGVALGGLIVLLFPVWVTTLGPARVHARIAANESAAVEDVRAVIAAEKRYALGNRDYYDTFDCLTRPQDCIPGYPASGPTIIDAPLAATAVRHGYHYELYLGPAAPSETAGNVSGSSVTCFAYVAVPVKAGITGQRTFCGDETGAVHVGLPGVATAIVRGQCPQGWPTLE